MLSSVESKLLFDNMLYSVESKFLFYNTFYCKKVCLEIKHFSTHFLAPRF